MALPPTNPAGLVRDAEDLNKVVNGDGTTNRAGESLPSVKAVFERINDDFDAMQSGELTAQAVEAADRAEIAAEVSAAAGLVYEKSAAGQADFNLADGDYFFVVSADSDEVLELWRKGATTATDTGKRTLSKNKIDDLESRIEDSSLPNYSFAIADESGNAILVVDENGNAHMPNLGVDDFNATIATIETIDYTESEVYEVATIDYEYAITDQFGNVVFGVTKSGKIHGLPEQVDDWRSLSIGTDDSIIHIGDSFTAGHYNLQDKNYVSTLSNVSPFRHINFGLSGDDAIEMQNRVISGDIYGRLQPNSSGARYAFITAYENDGQFRNENLNYYQENVRRLVEVTLASGVEPIITTEFTATPDGNAALRSIADEYGLKFIDCTSLDAEFNNLDVGPFHQGHPGMRTHGVFWIPMIKWIKENLPPPSRVIKIFRKRPTFTAAGVNDLLYKGDIDRISKFKEISIWNANINPPSDYDSLSIGGYTWLFTDDEYQKIQQGLPVSFSDYALIEATLPISGVTGEAIKILLNVTGAATVYIRDYLNPLDALPNSLVTDPVYLSDYNLPRGRWQEVTLTDGELLIESDLERYMLGGKVAILIAGAFDVSGLEVQYKGREFNRMSYPMPNQEIGANLVSQPLCGNPTQLLDWTVTGAPVTRVPIDVSMAPRKLDGSGPVDGVVYINNTDTIQQTAVLDAASNQAKRYKLTVWCRYFPKAFIDPAEYPGLDPEQTIDKVLNPSGSEITVDTNDFRMVKVNAAFGASIPSNGGFVMTGYTHLTWRPVEFIIDRVAWQSGNNLTFKISCPDGEVQVAKVLLNEVV